MNGKIDVKRGDIFFYNFGETKGSIQSGIRPVLIIQCDEGNKASPTTIVAAITSAVKKQYLPTHIVLGPDYGLRENSMVMLEQISTVNQNDLERFVGHIDDENLIRIINNAIKKSLGMWRFTPRNDDNVRCLCGRCLDTYMADAKFIVRRLNPYNKVKDKCEICGSMGYDYIVSDRRYGK